MRTLHINPRNFQEPFELIQVKHNAFTNGMDDYEVARQVTMFGSIMNRTINNIQGNMDDGDNNLSIKVIAQSIVIKPKDRILYNGSQYIVTSVDRDYYSKSEIVILCRFERQISKLIKTVLNFGLNSKLVG